MTYNSSCFQANAREIMLPWRSTNQKQQNSHTQSTSCSGTRVISFCTSRRKRHASDHSGSWWVLVSGRPEPSAVFATRLRHLSRGSTYVIIRPWISIPTSCNGLRRHTRQKLYQIRRLTYTAEIVIYTLCGGSPNARKGQDCMWHHENLVLQIWCTWRQRITIWIPGIPHVS